MIKILRYLLKEGIRINMSEYTFKLRKLKDHFFKESKNIPDIAFYNDSDIKCYQIDIICRNNYLMDRFYLESFVEIQYQRRLYHV